ncbi:MAG TPA: mycofactocin-coupled SDR family oxidoreductase [Nocardioides sp.]|uniref:mycofactocin-coupled SDR family oxidoreductase n=1 Tax=uncultured Nocardioides sp. TaxID=198441 RepID=UPI000EE2F7B5|nr:mycofactocin-coupled SDR family oxidoreductase [uncultured Nocardioides sp.]HCB04822.1 SDR family mycofactocin-dependent oxidoreductase [Nocardioides sp.]HRD62161.1 mycofactocin-coupled SDR family oxidoreductase [Nocardioides sp.]HRI94791.1 mycofactocin-coupled SDR family oxidoreductase [Nocardioides sp.]HRK45153.1 mycofactocin-coupled SDR family oxidoreductase [Nocardioides sp.]
MGQLDGKVALITGGARGQGRSHAVTFAREGADIVVCDLAEQIETVPYTMSNAGDLEETVRLVEALDQRCIAMRADVRDTAQINAVAERTVAEFGKIDILLANAGIVAPVPFVDITDQAWSDMVETDLTGVFKSIRAVAPQMIEQRSGRIIATSSMVGKTGVPGLAHYTAAKWGVIGLVKSAALEFGQYGITVNAVCPTNVDTPMIQNPAMYSLFAPDITNPSRDDVVPGFTSLNALPIPWVQAEDISAGMLYLAAESGRYVTGETLTIAAGWNANNAA